MKAMRGILTFACAAALSILALAPAAHAFPQTVQQGPYGARFLNYAGVTTDLSRPAPVDSLPFTLIAGTGNATTDTTRIFRLDGLLSQGVTTGGTSTAQPLLRITVTGFPSAVAVDTVYAYLEGCVDASGTCFTQGATVAPPINLLNPLGAAASDTTLQRRGVGSVYTAVVQLTPSNLSFATLGAYLWPWYRIRLRGDKDGVLVNAQVFVESVYDLGQAPARP